MKVMSYNIGLFVWAKYLPGFMHYCFHRKYINHIVKIINKENPDVVFLQEVMPEDIEFVYGYFPEYAHKLKVKVGERYSESIFMSKFAIQEIHHTDCEDFIINGITFFPIHLHAFSPEHRERQVDKLLEFLPIKKGVILGDANLWILNLFGKNIFLSRRDKANYKKLLNKHKDIFVKHEATSRAYLALDKFLITEDVKCVNSKIIKQSIGQMDHFPVLVELEI